MRILIIDPGSTSTKIGIYEDSDLVINRNIIHERVSINRFARIADQEEMRFKKIKKLLAAEGYMEKEFDAVVGRGGLIKPVQGGTYKVNETMISDLREGTGGQHASNLGGILAKRFAGLFSAPAYVVDPVVMDELEPLAGISGLKGVRRESIFHALNQKAVARKVAADLGKKYTEVNLIVAHLGGGISIGAHQNGRVIDVNNALDGDGPYSPERSGGLPLRGVMRLIREGIYSPEELVKTVSSKGGLFSYVGEVDLEKIVRRIDRGDEEAKLAFEGMAYQTAREIGALAAVLKGKVDGIILTGGGAKSDRLTALIEERVSFLGRIFIVPGELELKALAEGAARVLSGEEEAKIYS